MATTYIIPDLLASWPFVRENNDGLDEVRAECDAWVESFHLFEPSQFKKFRACDFSLLASLSARLETKDHLRNGCDLMSYFFVFDEYTDLANKTEARQIVKDVMGAFRFYDRPEEISKVPIVEMARQFFERTVQTCGKDEVGINRFIQDFDDYTSAVIQEADDRVHHRRRKVDDYLRLRRDTCGAKPCFSFFSLGLNIPAEVFEHPAMQILIECATDLIAMPNDMHSYGLEYSRGLDDHNIVTAIMFEHRLGLQDALEWLSKRAEATISRFLDAKTQLPSWGAEVDAAVQRYIQVLGRCVRGCDSWSYESQRYYGRNGLRIQKTRRVALMDNKSYLRKEQMQVAHAL